MRLPEADAFSGEPLLESCSRRSGDGKEAVDGAVKAPCPCAPSTSSGLFEPVRRYASSLRLSELRRTSRTGGASCAEAIVLLKISGGRLPFRKEGIRSIAVLGPMIDTVALGLQRLRDESDHVAGWGAGGASTIGGGQAPWLCARVAALPPVPSGTSA